MAFKRKALAPEQVVAVCEETAVDWMKSEVDKLTYAEKREFDKLAFKSGQQPTVFTLRAGLAPNLLARIQTSQPPECYLVAFQFGVEACSDSSLGLEWRYDTEAPIIKSTSMANVPPQVWREIGRYILKREEFTEGE